MQSQEEPSWILSPQTKRKLEAPPEYTFTWIDIIIVVLSMCTFCADIITGIHLALP